MTIVTKEIQDTITPKMALERLKEGNGRFVNNVKINRDLLQQVKDTSEGQYPFAVVLSCVDSRTSVELIFDQGIGDIFSIRLAGNVVNEDVLGSIEFACKVAGAKLIIVLGHSRCGAVEGACDSVEMGNLTTLLEKISPAVNSETTELSNRTSSNPAFVDKVAAINVQKAVKDIIANSPILQEMIETDQCGIIGGMHDITTGLVTFYDSSHI